MIGFSVKYKLLALIVATAFTFKSMGSINSHTYTTGIANFHSNEQPGIISCFGFSYHATYKCGTTFHIIN